MSETSTYEDEPAKGSAEARIQNLIRERNQARSDLQEVKAELSSLSEQVTGHKAAMESAVAAAKAGSDARVKELESQIKKSGYRELLLADKVSPGDMDDILEYLSFQYENKVVPVEGSTDKPDFKDWYEEVRKTNKVLRAAMKSTPSTKEQEYGIENGPTPPPEEKKASKAPIAPPNRPQNIVPPKTGDAGGQIDISKLKPGSAEAKAAMSTLTKNLFKR